MMKSSSLKRMAEPSALAPSVLHVNLLVHQSFFLNVTLAVGLVSININEYGSLVQ